MFNKTLLTLFGLSAAVLADSLSTCGTAQYYPSQYTCFDDSFLCPKTASQTYLRCGDACYLNTQYSCSNGQLIQVNPNGPEALLQCGATQFYASQYVCYDNYFLCPVNNGVPYLRCGAACYSNFQYTCVNDQLQQIPPPSCVYEYGSCEDQNGQLLDCCQGFSCVATKCRNLSTIGHSRRSEATFLDFA